MKSMVGIILVLTATAQGMSLSVAGEPSHETIVTHLRLDDCTQSGNVEDGGISNCDGLDGMRIVITESDLRQFVSFGARAEDEPAAQQTLPMANSIFAAGSQDTDIFWRIETSGTTRTTLAAIVRYHTETEGDDGATALGEVLVVTRLPAEGNSGVCHIGYIDALANDDAMVLAERAADEAAAGFNCAAATPALYGKPGNIPLGVDGD